MTKQSQQNNTFFFFFTFCVKVLITLVTCARLLTAVYIVDNSPYLKHLVYLDVQKCPTYVKCRGSEISLCKYLYANTHESLSLGSGVMSPSEQCCLYLLRGLEEVLGGSDNGHVVCVYMGPFQMPFLYSCILFCCVYTVYSGQICLNFQHLDSGC